MRGQTLSFSGDAPKICILRLSAIGDVCHAVAVVQALQKRWPKAQISWVIGKLEWRLLEGLAGIDFVVFDKSEGLAAYKKLRQHFSGQRFDVLLHMQVALRASLASLCIPAAKKIGFDRARAKEGQWLFTDVGVHPQNEPHVLEGFQDFAAMLDVAPTAPSWQMPLDKEAEIWAEAQAPDQPFAIISAAASKAERNWLPQRYAQVADYLHNRGLRVLLCGGPAAMDKELAQVIIDEASCPLQNFVAKTNLKQLLSLIKRASLVIAPDTGPAHMAVSVGTPVVGLYAHSNPRRTGPYLYQNYVASAYEEAVLAQHGKPWSDLPWGTRVKGEHLMANIQVDTVIERIDAVVRDYNISLSRRPQ